MLRSPPVEVLRLITPVVMLESVWPVFAVIVPATLEATPLARSMAPSTSPTVAVEEVELAPI